MGRVANKKIILMSFLEWYFFDQPKVIFKAWVNFLKFNLEYFSIIYLLRTLFSPWRNYTWSYGRGFDFKVYLEAFVSNAISRALGAILRIILIIVGIILEILIFFLGLFLLFLWFLWPLALLFVFILGLRVLF
jgi:hypothetical protein